MGQLGLGDASGAFCLLLVSTLRLEREHYQLGIDILRQLSACSGLLIVPPSPGSPGQKRNQMNALGRQACKTCFAQAAKRGTQLELGPWDPACNLRRPSVRPARATRLAAHKLAIIVELLMGALAESDRSRSAARH